jgi:serine/threonine protein kinase
MKDLDIWDKYQKIKCIGSGTYAEVYEAKNKENGKYVAIKRINKFKMKNVEKYNSEIEKMELLKNESSISLIETFNSRYNFYIIMELCLLNLEEYMKIRNEGISIEELKDILIELNKILKKMNDENIIHRDLKLSNILISLNKLNKISIKLCDFGLSKKYNEDLSITPFGTSLTMSPEFMEEANINSKNDIWSLGVIIYFLLFNEYPYNGKTEILLNKDIHSGKKLKTTNNNDLNDLIKKMLCINYKERISWDDYFNHSFFKHKIDNNVIIHSELFFRSKKNIYNKNIITHSELSFKSKKSNIIQFPQFQFNCKTHNQIYKAYCSNCKMNICDQCFNNHSNHNLIPFNKIGLNEEEILQKDQLIKEIELNFQHINKIKQDINAFLNSIKNIQLNNNIYNNDNNNNYKYYYIQFLKIIKDKFKIEENIKFIDLDESKYQIYNKGEIIEIEL